MDPLPGTRMDRSGLRACYTVEDCQSTNYGPSMSLPYHHPEERRGRTGYPRVQSLSHVFQRCPIVHYDRIKRHDHIVQKLAFHCRKKGFWEVTRTLDASWTQKRLVYNKAKFREAAQRLWPGRTFHFFPVVVGACGVWYGANSPTVGSLRIPLHLRQSIVTACVQ